VAEFGGDSTEAVREDLNVYSLVHMTNRDPNIIETTRKMLSRITEKKCKVVLKSITYLCLIRDYIII
jgi:hypothetical protein